ncbi:MAG: amidohydrolase family protein, partial [Bacteroidota bacterium]
LPEAFAFRNITVVDTDRGRLVDGQTVVVRDGRLDRVTSEPPPDELAVIDGCDRFLVPGLADMHVHLRREDLTAYLRSGVTTVRNLWGFPGLQSAQAEIDAGALRGPTVYGISPGLDGTPVKWPVTQLVMDPAEAEATVQRQLDAGWTALKLYDDLRSEPFDAIIEAAQAKGVTYGGHVPRRVGIDRALGAGYRHIEHLSGYEQRLNPSGGIGAFAWRTIDASLIDELVQATVDAGTWNCPTLAIFDDISRGDATIRANRQRVVRALFEGGAGLLIGTDAGIGRTAPGTSVHDEMALFEGAGLTPAEVLRIATVEAARFLDAENAFGRIAAGLRADLLLVTHNPLEDLDALRQPEVVIARGVRMR